MNNNHLKTRFLVIVSILTVLMVSMFANEKAPITNVFNYDTELDITIEEYKGVSVLSVQEFLSAIDKDEAIYQYKGNKTYAKVTIGDVEYRFYRYRPYYYQNSKRILYSTKEMNGITIPSNFRAYGKDGQIFIPYGVLLNALDITFIYDANVLSFEFGENIDTTVPNDELTIHGREDFDPASDSVETPADLKAFEEKYGLGNYVTAEKIPTKYDLNPSLYEGTGSDVLWNSELGFTFADNPPTLTGKDGSLPPYGATTDVFFDWLIENDPYIGGKYKQASGKYGGATPSDYDLERGTYYHGLYSIWSNYADDNFYVVDTELSSYELHDMDAVIHNKLWKPVNAVYTRMILIHYLGETEGEKAYKLYSNGWRGIGDVQIRESYTFGDREIMFLPQQQGMSIEIGEPGYSFNDDLYNGTSGYDYDGNIYHNPFSDDYKPFK